MVLRAPNQKSLHLQEHGTAIINLDDQYADFLKQKSAAFKQLSYSISSSEADLFAADIKANERGFFSFQLHTQDGNIAITLQIPGRHQINNALAAASMAFAAGCSLQDIQRGLQSASTSHGRMQLHQFNKIAVMDDSYNANPASVKAAIDWLGETKGESWLILGDLGELGEDASSFHQELGLYAAQKKVSRVFTLGTLSELTSQSFGTAHHFSDFQQLWTEIQHHLPDDKALSILVKGFEKCSAWSVSCML